MNTSEQTTVADITAKDMVLRLMDDGMSATDISEALGQRVSRRTIYRWAKGESEPQQSSDLVELNKLYGQKCAS
jgi:hypothetical protein